MTAGQVAVQASHASIEASRHFIQEDDDHPHLVLLQVKNELRLEKLVSELKEAGIPFISFVEPDLNNSLTAIATKPINGISRNFFKKFCLYN